MSYEPDGPASAALTGFARGAHWLMDFHFTTGTLYYTTAPVDVLSPNGHTYIGTNGAIWIEDVKESPNNSTDSINIKAGIVETALMAMLSNGDSVNTYRNRVVLLHLQVLDEKFKPVGQPIHRWSGMMNPIRITRQKPDESNGNTIGQIELPCQRIGMARSRNRLGLRVVHEQQIVRYPGDLGLEYLKPLVANPPPWLTIAFQRI
jgi:hypothetical protein